MADYVRMVFDRLLAAGSPDAAERERIFAGCRADVGAAHADGAARQQALEKLEKVIRRQELQALYEETLKPR